MSVTKPKYYNTTEDTYEPLKIIQAHNLNFCLGNVIKYTLRAGKKNVLTEIEDLEKAVEYLNREIESLRLEEQKDLDYSDGYKKKLNKVLGKSKNNKEENGLSHNQNQYAEYIKYCIPEKIAEELRTAYFNELILKKII